MLTFFLTYWRQLAGFLVGLVVVSLIDGAVHRFQVAALEKSHAAQLEAQKADLMALCAKTKQTTEEVSHDYQNQLSTLRDQLARAKRVRPSTCIPVHVAQPAAGRDGAAQHPELPLADGGVAADALLDFAYDAEQVGRQLDACQSFITKERQTY